MLRQILRLQFAARQSSKKVVARFFSNKSTKVATESTRKNSKNGAIFSSNLITSTKFTGPLGTSAFKKYSTSQKSNIDESFEDINTLLNKSVQEKDAEKALEYATKAIEISVTPEQRLAGMHMKLFWQIRSNKPDWDVDDFLAALQKSGGADFVDFGGIWNTLSNVLCKLGSYDTRCTTFFDKTFKVFPNNFIVIMKKAEVLFHYGLVDEVEPLLLRAIEIDPNRSKPLVLLWKLHPTQEEYLEKAIKCPDAANNTLLWCECAKKQILQDNDIEAGMESLKKAIAAVAKKPISLEVEKTLSDIANQLYSKNDLKSAEKVVQLWLEESPKRAPAWSTLGTIRYDQKNHQEAERCYRKAIELDPSLALVWYNLGDILAPKEGIPLLLQAIKLQPDLHIGYHRLAEYYRDLQQYEKALESINKALQFQKPPHYTLLKAEIYSLLKRYKEEFLTIREFLDPTKPQSACLLFDMEERYEEGLAYVREQIKRNPGNYLFFLNEATFLGRLKRFDEALNVIDQAIENMEENDDNDQHFLSLEATLLARSGNIIDAKQLVEVLQQLYGPLIGTHPLGIVYLKEGNYDKALEMFDKSLNRPGAAGLRYTYFMDIAAVYEAKGDLEAAEKYLNLVLEINPDSKSAAEKLEEIKMQKNR